MPSRWKWLLIHYGRQLWVRALLFALVGLLSALAAAVISPIVPAGWAAAVGADSLDNILGILASSLLAVATFSLSTMVAAYGSASSGTTPRVVQLLMADSRVQNAIATFIGGFLFSLVAIIALATGLYGEDGRIVLFAVTIVVAALIVITFIRSIEHVSRLGRVSDAIDRVATTATRVLSERRADPWLGGQPRGGRLRPGFPLFTDRIGHVQHLDMAALQAVAAAADGEVHVEALPGKFIDPSRPIAWTSFAPDDAARDRMRDAFTIDRHRSYDQDPRFGVVVLAEIGAKALSAGINDTGTAIEVLSALVRVLAAWLAPADQPEVRFDRVFLPEVAIEDLFEAAFYAIGHDGAAALPVGIKLQKTLAILARLGDERAVAAARHQSHLALARAKLVLRLPDDVERLAATAVELRQPAVRTASS